jgi:DNA-directed RNA polymerase subunit alpha
MLDIQSDIGLPKVVTTAIDDKTMKFELQYVPRGFGHTLGNAMRRAILGYNIGGAITGMKIKGVSHEYHVIDGIKEPIIDIMQNFKGLRFTIDEKVEHQQWIPQKFKGARIYTSADIKLPSGVEILDADVYLCEISDPSVELIFDLRVEKGYFYYSIDFLRRREEKENDSDVNLLLIDNDFKAVEYVTYDVIEVIDDFQGGLKDMLVIEIKSKYPTISPKQFISFAGEVVASYAKLFVFDDIFVDGSVFVELDELHEEKEKLPEELNIKTMPIDALPLSERTRNALIKNSILYVEDLEKKRKVELLTMKGLGKKAIDEIIVALQNINKNLAG